MVIVGELRRVEEVCPIVLLTIAEHADVCLHPFVVVLHLSLCLWMVGGREPLVDVQRFEEALCVIGSEEGPSICIVYSGNSVILPHVFEV